jgi:hypothetical protein
MTKSDEKTPLLSGKKYSLKHDIDIVLVNIEDYIEFDRNK